MKWPECESGPDARQHRPASKDFGTQTETTNTCQAPTSKSELFPASPHITSTAPDSYLEIRVTSGQPQCKGCRRVMHAPRPQTDHCDMGLVNGEPAGGDTA